MCESSVCVRVLRVREEDREREKRGEKEILYKGDRQQTALQQIIQSNDETASKYTDCRKTVPIEKYGKL